MCLAHSIALPKHLRALKASTSCIDAPTVSSDIVLMLRDNLDPGPPGRPLEQIGRRFWRVPSGYPTFSN